MPLIRINYLIMKNIKMDRNNKVYHEGKSLFFNWRSNSIPYFLFFIGLFIFINSTKLMAQDAPLFKWEGTAPTCEPSSNPPAGYPYLWYQSAAGGPSSSPCWSGHKNLWSNTPKACYTDLEWVGTAPCCNGRASDCAKKGKECLTTGSAGDGALCTNGDDGCNMAGGSNVKVLCGVRRTLSDLKTQASLSSNLSSYNSPQQTVFYLDDNSNVNLVYSSGDIWIHQNVTTIANAPAAAKGSSLTSYNSPQQTVGYLDDNGNVNLIFTNGTTWKHQNLTTTASAPAAEGSSLTSYNSPQQTMGYIDGNGNVNLIFTNSGTWKHQNLSTTIENCCK
jgi:hypothetical protein